MRFIKKSRMVVVSLLASVSLLGVFAAPSMALSTFWGGDVHAGTWDNGSIQAPANPAGGNSYWHSYISGAASANPSSVMSQVCIQAVTQALNLKSGGACSTNGGTYSGAATWAASPTSRPLIYWTSSNTFFTNTINGGAST